MAYLLQTDRFTISIMVCIDQSYQSAIKHIVGTK